MWVPMRSSSKNEGLRVVLASSLWGASEAFVSWLREKVDVSRLELSNLLILHFPSGEAVGGLVGGLTSRESLINQPKSLAFNAKICSGFDLRG